MMNYFLIMLLSCSFFPTAFSSSSSQYFSTVQHDSESEESSEESVSLDITALFEEISRYIDSKEHAIYLKRSFVISRLKKVVSKDSPIILFPHLDENTYNKFICALRKKFLEDRYSAHIVLHLWSYIVGIPIIGLKEDASYYHKNRHLLPNAVVAGNDKVVVGFTSEVICAKVLGSSEPFSSRKSSESKHRHYSLSDALTSSIVVTRKEFLSLSLSRDEKEEPALGWNLLEEGLLPLNNISDTLENDPLQSLLGCLLKIDENSKPFYSWCIITLLQNTALYISPSEDTTGVIVTSPCSKETAAYLGFIDGIFIHKGKSSRKDIHQLFGVQFFRRSFFKKSPCLSHKNPIECDACKQTLRCLYYPHYSFALLKGNYRSSIQDLLKGHTVEEASGIFANAFAHYMRAGKEKRQDDFLVRALIVYLSEQQLREPLTNAVSLAEKLFEPAKFVNLADQVDKIYNQMSSGPGNDNSATSSTGWKHHDNYYRLTAHAFMARLVKHLRCLDYQVLNDLNISRNSLTNQEALLLGEVLDRNVLPDLQFLDLSHNKIGRSGIKAFGSLLRRDAFKKLRAVDNSFQAKVLEELGSVSAKVDIQEYYGDSSESTS